MHSWSSLTTCVCEMKISTAKTFTKQKQLIRSPTKDISFGLKFKGEDSV